jgi:hypothetical protein
VFGVSYLVCLGKLVWGLWSKNGGQSGVAIGMLLFGVFSRTDVHEYLPEIPFH